MTSDNGNINSLWLYCRDSFDDDAVNLDQLIDSNIEKINILAGRQEDFQIPPLMALLVSKKTAARKLMVAKRLLDRGAYVNCLDESGQNALAYMIKRYPWATEEQQKIIELLQSYGAVLVKGHSSDFFLDLLMEKDEH
jgi:hypothetical protein